MKWFEKYFDEPVSEAPFIMIPITNPILLGHQAEDALKNPAINLALETIEKEIFTAWKSSPPKDEEARERLYYRLEGLAHFRTKLQGMINNMVVEMNKAKRQAA
jgi:hypothetical protein